MIALISVTSPPEKATGQGCDVAVTGGKNSVVSWFEYFSVGKT
jgi:hypothetical protein